MNTLALTAGVTGTPEAVLFWILAPLSVLAAFGMVLAKKAVHSALFLAYIMISLAIFYMAQDAPFLGIVQIVVYTGAVMMLFLFILMLVGVDSSDSLVETIRGQRLAAILIGLGLGVLLVGGLGHALSGSVQSPAVGLDTANIDGNVQGLAALLFSRYVWAFEVVSALLVTAALGAMVLGHRERTTPRRTQRQLSQDRFQEGSQLPGSTLPNPGVFSRHNAVDVPALLPDGTPAPSSVSRVIKARGGVLPPDSFELKPESEESDESR
ncbi:MAG TPA: NADH-quinone oxidoreductase subunit J [Candidatus Nanopelagicaceae bacterium]|nr:NADH-quinone oxidoreductase subunit J [Candidatus Nanopelagicaceae bacterium]